MHLNNSQFLHSKVIKFNAEGFKQPVIFLILCISFESRMPQSDYIYMIYFYHL